MFWTAVVSDHVSFTVMLETSDTGIVSTIVPDIFFKKNQIVDVTAILFFTTVRPLHGAWISMSGRRTTSAHEINVFTGSRVPHISDFFFF